MMVLFANPDIMLFIFFNQDTMYTAPVISLKLLFYTFPSFILTIIYDLIAKIGAKHQDSSNFGWMQGREYTWNDFFSPVSGIFTTG